MVPLRFTTPHVGSSPTRPRSFWTPQPALEHGIYPLWAGELWVAITFAPRHGAILLCDFDMARVHPEIDKKRQVIVVSISRLNHRHASAAGHCTVVPTSSREPHTIGPEDVLISSGKYWSFRSNSWVRAKMLTTVSHDRLDLLLRNGRPHRTEFIEDSDMERIQEALRHVMNIA